MQPDWFKHYLEQVPVQRSCEVQGASISYLHWQNPGRPGLVFVHGHAAHAHWWDFIAPAFARDYDIVAIDQSGSGDSDHRDTYSAALFAEEIVECADHAGLNTPVVVGHSFGGSMTRIAAYLYAESLAAIIIVDSAIPPTKGDRTPPPMPRRRDRFYASIEEGKRRFRLRPPQPCENDYILDYIAGYSLRSTDHGYQFKLDSAVFAKMSPDEDFPAAADMVRSLKIPVALIYGEQSRFFPAAIADKLDTIFNAGLIKSIPGAHHHVFLDQPLAFIETLKELLYGVVRRDAHHRRL